ncbi:hypothetical protein [Leptospira kirschneri]|uniref:hypothetical protein n=1 Tax=Leptospira kirschneri TaxID=29507 RepID=UPI0009E29382|nr:hypothetical protein [Leptospira kirschneri]
MTRAKEPGRLPACGKPDSPRFSYVELTLNYLLNSYCFRNMDSEKENLKNYLASNPGFSSPEGAILS